MLKPSYSDLMTKLSESSSSKKNSRYSIVIASSKRARELVDGAQPLTKSASADKPVSIAVQEIYEGSIKIISQ